MDRVCFLVVMKTELCSRTVVCRLLGSPGGAAGVGGVAELCPGHAQVKAMFFSLETVICLNGTCCLSDFHSPCAARSGFQSPCGVIRGR